MRDFINIVEHGLINMPRGGTRVDVRSEPAILSNPEFMKWFEGSKVTDRDGNPLVCYHGSYFDFTKFQNKDLGKGGAGNGFNSIGYWFDVDTGVPNWLAGYEEGYEASDGGTVYPCFLSIKKPWVIDSEWLWDEDREKLIKMTEELKELLHRKRTEDDRLGNISDAIYFLRQKRDKLMNEIAHDRDDAFYRMMKMLPNGIKSTTAEVMQFKNELIAEGYDGIWLGDTIADFSQRDYKVSDWWIAFHPNQIKSVFAKEFNPDSDHIHEQRLTESLSQPVEWEWSHRLRPHSDTAVATFEVDDRDYRVRFTKPARSWQFAFDQHGDESVTGDGGAFIVFATVIDILKDFVAEMDPDIVNFSSDTPSRARLYRRFIDTFIRPRGYSVEEKSLGNITQYTIEKQKSA